MYPADVALKRSERRLLFFFAALPLSMLLFGTLYMVGMRLLEGEVRGFWESVGWAAETLTTTGYGSDAKWTHPLMWVLVIFVQFAGVLMVVAVFPIYLIPFFEERFEGRIPGLTASALEGRILLNRHGAAIGRLLDELDAAGLEPVVFEEDEGTARTLFRRGVNVMYGTAADAETIAAFAKASAIITNGPDDEDAAMILGVRGQGFEGPVVALVSSPAHRHPLILAGADAAYTPRHLLAAELCARADGRIAPRVGKIGKLGDELAIFDIRVLRDGELRGMSLGELEAKVEGSEVIGVVDTDERLSAYPADHTLGPGSRIVLRAPVAAKEVLDALAVSSRTGRPFCVLGDGEVAGKIKEMLTDVGEEVVLVASEAREGVDAHGDLLDPATLERGGVREAAAVVLALENDAATLFVTTVLRSHAPDVPTVAGVERGARVQRTRASGADFVIALDEVMGRVLAHHVLEGRRGDTGLVLRRRKAGALAPTPANADAILARTGCAVLGVIEDDELRPLAKGETVSSQTRICVCGSVSAIRSYEGS